MPEFSIYIFLLLAEFAVPLLLFCGNVEIFRMKIDIEILGLKLLIEYLGHHESHDSIEQFSVLWVLIVCLFIPEKRKLGLLQVPFILCFKVRSFHF